MRFERTDSFKADWRRLSDAERELFRSAGEGGCAGVQDHDVQVLGSS